MLLIDGMQYELWTPQREVEEFHPIVKEHSRQIFGKNSIDIEGKKLVSEAGIGSKLDWFVIVLDKPAQWHIVEAELSSHPIYDHVVNQVGRFINGVKNVPYQRKIAEMFYGEITTNRRLKVEIEDIIGSGEIYKFLADLVSQPPILTIIIEKKTPEFDEAINLLRYSPINILESQTFLREGVGLPVHAHLFEPLRRVEEEVIEGGEEEEGEKIKGEGRGRKVTFQELERASLIKDKQVLNFYNTRLFADEYAEVVVSSNELKYGDGRLYSKSELAKVLLINHGFKHDEHGVAGPKYWRTQNGVSLLELEEQVRGQRGDRV